MLAARMYACRRHHDVQSMRGSAEMVFPLQRLHILQFVAECRAAWRVPYAPRVRVRAFLDRFV